MAAATIGLGTRYLMYEWPKIIFWLFILSWEVPGLTQSQTLKQTSSQAKLLDPTRIFWRVHNCIYDVRMIQNWGIHFNLSYHNARSLGLQNLRHSNTHSVRLSCWIQEPQHPSSGCWSMHSPLAALLTLSQSEANALFPFLINIGWKIGLKNAVGPGHKIRLAFYESSNLTVRTCNSVVIYNFQDSCYNDYQIDYKGQSSNSIENELAQTKVMSCF